MRSKLSKNRVLTLLAVVFFLANTGQSWGHYEHEATDDCVEIISGDIDIDSENSTQDVKDVKITVKHKEVNDDDSTNTAGESEGSESELIEYRPHHRCHVELPTP